MYANGSIVTLLQNKSHGEGDSAISINAGICGMIVSHRMDRSAMYYIVDFGAEGQWNVAHSELSGDDQEEGWDTDNINITESTIRFGVENEYITLDDFGDSPFEGVSVEDNNKIDPEADIARRIAEIERGE